MTFQPPIHDGLPYEDGRSVEEVRPARGGDFPAWLDQQLESLERRFDDFVTANSQGKSLRRGRGTSSDC